MKHALKKISFTCSGGFGFCEACCLSSIFSCNICSCNLINRFSARADTARGILSNTSLGISSNVLSIPEFGKKWGNKFTFQLFVYIFLPKSLKVSVGKSVKVPFRSLKVSPGDVDGIISKCA